ncbi:MAG: winged helix-turn-helix domain-containing protein [Rhizobiales bacterium]|nr:winged helix-turn-helix domain-containing protein [Hyphomicrobiales bacterium]
MSTAYPLEAATARHVILHLQGLTETKRINPPHEALYQRIEALGFVQIDSIKWVERAHHMILYARDPSYRPAQLERLVCRDKRLFENWTHDASFIPGCFFPYWRHKFARENARLEARFASWQGDGFLAHRDLLLERIRTRGALMSRDLERPAAARKEMWQWHDGKAALEFLWRTGRLGIRERRNFQKVYDLTERCLHPQDLERRISHADFVDWACRAALARLGFATAADVARFFDLVTIDEAKTWLARQDGQGVRPVRVEGADGTERDLSAPANIEEIVETLAPLPARVRCLSPFDPVIRDRKRLAWLWGFDYRIEIYIPVAKRLWGYYVFPLLERDRLIGRIDMKADRQAGRLVVRRLWLEDGVKMSASRKRLISAELVRQAHFCALDGVEWDGVVFSNPTTASGPAETPD